MKCTHQQWLVRTTSGARKRAPLAGAHLYTLHTLSKYTQFTLLLFLPHLFAHAMHPVHTVFTKNAVTGAKTVYTGIHYLEVHTMFAHTLCNQGVHCVYTMF